MIKNNSEPNKMLQEKKILASKNGRWQLQACIVTCITRTTVWFSSFIDHLNAFSDSCPFICECNICHTFRPRIDIVSVHYT